MISWTWGSYLSGTLGGWKQEESKFHHALWVKKTTVKFKASYIERNTLNQNYDWVCPLSSFLHYEFSEHLKFPCYVYKTLKCHHCKGEEFERHPGISWNFTLCFSVKLQLDGCRWASTIYVAVGRESATEKQILEALWNHVFNEFSLLEELMENRETLSSFGLVILREQFKPNLRFLFIAVKRLLLLTPHPTSKSY